MMTDWIKKVDAMDAANGVLADAKEHGWNGVEAICLMKNSLLGMADAEMQYLLAFARENDFTSEMMRDQLRALWTTYCFHHNLDPDTLAYDEDLLELWEIIAEAEERNYWNDENYDGYTRFGNFMCAFFGVRR